MPNVPPRGWYVEVDHPNRSTPFRPDVIASELSYTPVASEQPTLDIPVRQTDTWLDDSWDGEAVRVWKDGMRLPITGLKEVEVRPGKTILHCVGGGVTVGEGLRQRVDESYLSAGTVPALRDLVAETTEFNVETLPVPTTSETVTLADIDTQLDWDEFQAERRTPETTPFIAENGTLRLATSCYRFEGENPDFDAAKAVMAAPDDDSLEWSEYQALVIGGQPNEAGTARWDFTPEYEIGAGDATVWARIRAPDGTHDGFEAVLDGETLPGFEPDALLDTGTVQWRPIGTADSALTAGKQTSVRFEITDGSSAQDDDAGELILDQIAVADNTYDHKFSEWGDDYLGDGVLLGPATKPQSVETVFDDVLYETLQFIDEATIDVVAGTPGTVSRLGLNVGDSVSPGSQFTETDTASVTVDPGELGARAAVSPILGLSRRDENNNNTTPRDGTGSETVEDLTITATVDTTPLLLDRDLSGELADVLTQIAEEQDLQWELQFAPTDDVPTVRIGRAGTGETRAPEDLLNWSVSRDKSETVDAVRVRGGRAPVRNEQLTPANVTDGPDATLDNDEVIRNTEILRDPATGEEFTRGEDYSITYTDGTIELLTGSGMDYGTTYAVFYDFKPSGEYSWPDVTTDETDLRVVQIPTLSSPRPCALAARLLVEQLTEPLIRAEATVSKLPPWFSVFDTLDLSALPDEGRPYDIARLAGGEGETTIALDSRQEIGEEIQQFRARVGTTEQRV